MNRNCKEDLINEIEQNKGLLSIKALGEYRKNGIVVETRRAATGFVFDRELLLNDGTSIVAWI